jgi:hypothetical protein
MAAWRWMALLLQALLQAASLLLFSFSDFIQRWRLDPTAGFPRRA